MNLAVEVRVKSKKLTGNAVVIDEPACIIDFLLIRYERHPKILGKILKSEGVPIPPSPKDLRKYSKGMAMVVIDSIP